MKPKLSFMATTEGFIITQDKYQPGWIMPYVHYHTYHEIYILGYGERLVEIDNSEFTVSEYQATFFRGGTAHKSSGSSAFSGLCICFEEKFLDNYVTEKAKKQLMKCFSSPVATLTEEEYYEAKCIADSYTPFDKNNFVKLIKLLDILNTATSRSEYSFNESVVSVTSKSQQILNYIRDNFRTIQSSKEIADLFEVSESYVFKLCKNAYDISFRQYVNKLKLRNACQLLIYRPDRNAKTISSDCGFESYEHFMRLFKKKMGCTPLEYRKNNIE